MEELEKMQEQIKAHLDNQMHRAAREFAVLMVNETKLRFNSGTDIHGNSFARKKDGSSSELTQRGHLRDTVSKKVQGTTITITAGSSSVKYAKIHNQGGKIKTRRGKGKKKSRLNSKPYAYMPKREYLGFTNKHVQLANKIMIKNLSQ